MQLQLLLEPDVLADIGLQLDEDLLVALRLLLEGALLLALLLLVARIVARLRAAGVACCGWRGIELA